MATHTPRPCAADAVGVALAAALAATTAGGFPARAQDVCTDAFIAVQDRRANAAVERGALEDARAASARVAAACGPGPRTFQAFFLAGVTSAALGDPAAAAGYLTTLRDADPGAFVPPMSWALMSAYAALGDAEAFIRERDVFIARWLRWTADAGVAAFKETIKSPNGPILALEFSAFDPELRQDVVFVLVPDGPAWPHTVSLGSYAARTMVVRQRTGDPDARAWHVNSYNCRGEADLGVYDRARPSYLDLRTRALFALSQPDAAVAITAASARGGREEAGVDDSGCASAHLVAPMPEPPAPAPIVAPPPAAIGAPEAAPPG